MKLLKTLFWAGAAAAAFPMVRRLLTQASQRAPEDTNASLPVVEKMVEKHAGEDSQIVQAFAHAVEDARHSHP